MEGGERRTEGKKNSRKKEWREGKRIEEKGRRKGRGRKRMTKEDKKEGWKRQLSFVVFFFPPGPCRMDRMYMGGAARKDLCWHKLGLIFWS